MTTPTSAGVELDLSPEAFGTLRSSIDLVGDVAALRARMAEDGYLFLPGYLDRPQVLAARADVLSGDRSSLEELLYGGRMMAFYERFLGEAVRHFDFTWLRAVPPGRGTLPHADSVFMNRGATDALYTAWTPLGDIDTTLGGLIVAPGTHRLHRIRYEYGTRDVDAYCSNVPEADVYASGQRWMFDGTLSDNPRELREQLGVPWLTADFRAGDLLTFTPYTVHASLDNQGTETRLSSDSRYQPARLPADERWVGPDPSAHGPDSKVAFIC